MPDYGEILQFLSQNPPQIAAERQLHASLLELLAQCLRDGGDTTDENHLQRPMSDDSIPRSHFERVHFR